jgi:hypothetical protein
MSLWHSRVCSSSRRFSCSGMHSVLAVLMPESEHNDAVIHSALDHADGKPVVFLYPGSGHTGRTPRLFQFHDPYYDDEQAKQAFGRAEQLHRSPK